MKRRPGILDVPWLQKEHGGYHVCITVCTLLAQSKIQVEGEQLIEQVCIAADQRGKGLFTYTSPQACSLNGGTLRKR